MPLFFWFDLSLETRAEILKNFCCYFGTNDFFIRTFWNYLTFRCFFLAIFIKSLSIRYSLPDFKFAANQSPRFIVSDRPSFIKVQFSSIWAIDCKKYRQSVQSRAWLAVTIAENIIKFKYRNSLYPSSDNNCFGQFKISRHFTLF